MTAQRDLTWFSGLWTQVCAPGPVCLHIHADTHKYFNKEAMSHILLNCCHVITLISLGSAGHECTLLNYGL